MRSRMVTLVAALGFASGVQAGETDLAKALQAVIAAESCQFTTQAPNTGAGVDAKYQKGSPLHVRADGIEFFRKGDVLVYKQGDIWQRTRTGTLSDPLRILAATSKVRAVRVPQEELAQIGKALTNVKKTMAKAETILSSELNVEAVRQLARTEDRDLARDGTAKFWLDDRGRLAKYEIAIRVQGRRGNAEVDGVVTRTVWVSAVGTTKVEVPVAAKKVLE